MQCYGREQVLADLTTESRSVLLTGDSGIGKTTALTVATAGPERILSEIELCARRPGMLLQVILRCLGSALSQASTSEGELVNAGRYVLETTKRNALKLATALPAAAAKEILVALRAYVGEGVGDAIGELISELRQTYDERLEAQLQAAVTPETYDVLLGQAVAVLAYVQRAGFAGAILRIDRIEELAPEDGRLLADVIRGLPQGLSIRGAHRTATVEERSAVDQLILAGACELALDPLGESSILDWILAAERTDLNASAVLSETGGYPIIIQSLIAAQELPPAAPEAIFRVAVRSAWSRLGSDDRVASQRLATFSVPLADEHVEALLHLDADHWRVLRQRLEELALFSAAGARSWFHPLRRNVLWEEMLDDAARGRLAREALDFMSTQLGLQASLDSLPEFARLAQSLTAADDPTDELRAVVALEDGPLSLLCGLIDLQEGPASPFVEGGALLNYARDVYPSTSPDLIADLEHLAELGLAFAHVESGVAVVAPILRSGLQVMVASGCGASRFGRVPIARSASTAFELAMRPRLLNFLQAEFGVGRPRLDDLAETAHSLEQVTDSDGVLHVSTTTRNGIIFRGYYGQRPLWGAATFDNSDYQRASRDGLNGYLTEQFGQYIHVSEVYEQPADTVKDRRLLAALELLGVETRLRRPGQMERPLTVKQRAERKAALIRAARYRLSDVELAILGWDEPIGFVVWQEPDARVEALITGGRTDVRLLPVAGFEGERLAFNQDPFISYRVANQLGLAANERLSRWTLNVGRSDLSNQEPMSELALEAQSHAARYNKRQSRYRLELAESSIAEVIEDALLERLADAQAVFRELEPTDDYQLRPQSIGALIALERGPSGWVTGHRSDMAIGYFDEPEPTAVCSRVVFDSLPDEDEHGRFRLAGDVRERIQSLHPGKRLARLTSTAALDGIAHLLSLDASYLRLTLPSE